MKYKRLQDEENTYSQIILCPKKRIFCLLTLQLIALSLIYSLFSSYNYFTKPTNVIKESFYFKSWANKKILSETKIPSDSKIRHLPELRKFELASFFISSKLSESIYCFIDGTDLTSGWETGCSCKEGYFGFDCGVPLHIYKSGILDIDEIYIIKRNMKARRIILSVILKDCIFSELPLTSKTVSEGLLTDVKENDDLEECISFLETLFIQTREVVDLFLIGLLKNDVNISQPLFTKYINETLNNSNVLYIEHISKNVSSIKEILWDNIVTYISDFRGDDLIIIMDPFAFPLKEILLFLKLYDGFPEPITFLGNQNNITNHISFVSNTVHSYNETNIGSFGITFQYFSTLCEYNFARYLENKCQDEVRLNKYESHYWTVKEWIINDSIY